MQYARPDQQTLTQADLFHNALMATRMEHNQFARLQQPKPLSSTEEQEYGYSEISLQGAEGFFYITSGYLLRYIAESHEAIL